jgi:hypothetical protein
MDRIEPGRFRLSRRAFLGYVGPAVVGAGALSFPRVPAFAGDEKNEPSPAPLVETPSQDEGPFYRAGAPDRSDLRRKDAGVAVLTVSGLVRAEDGKSLPGVRLDLWHADPSGNYDDSKEFRYRGVLTSDAVGKFTLVTDLPGRYRDGPFRARPRHVHAKLSGKGLYDLTTQMYFGIRPDVDAPGECVVALEYAGEGKTRTATGTWNPVLSRKPDPKPAPKAPK